MDPVHPKATCLHQKVPYIAVWTDLIQSSTSKELEMETPDGARNERQLIGSALLAPESVH